MINLDCFIFIPCRETLYHSSILLSLTRGVSLPHHSGSPPPHPVFLSQHSRTLLNSYYYLIILYYC